MLFFKSPQYEVDYYTSKKFYLQDNNNNSDFTFTLTVLCKIVHGITHFLNLLTNFLFIIKKKIYLFIYV